MAPSLTAGLPPDNLGTFEKGELHRSFPVVALRSAIEDANIECKREQ
jgi:hypothetical protein